jgi:hypothetical protein
LAWLAGITAAGKTRQAFNPHFSPNRMHWGVNSEKVLLSPQVFSN